MKLLFTSITLLSTLAIFTHAASEDTAVFYQGGDVDVTDHINCIAFKKGSSTMQAVQFGVPVQCHTFGSNDCSGDAVNLGVLSFEAEKDISPEEFGPAYPFGSFKCDA